MPASDFSAYSELFFKTAEDHINGIEESLSTILSSDNKTDLVSEIYRSVHSLKGSSTVMGFTAIADICGQIGNIVHPHDGVFEVSGKAVEEIRQLVENLKNAIAEAKKV